MNETIRQTTRQAPQQQSNKYVIFSLGGNALQAM